MSLFAARFGVGGNLLRFGCNLLGAGSRGRLLSTNRLPMIGTDVARDRLVAYFQETWSLTEMLFDGAHSGLYLRPADALRHPLIFYYGHVASFYVNKLRLAGVDIRAPCHPFDELFAVGVDENAEDAEKLSSFVFPDLAAVSSYREMVRSEVVRTIRTHPDLADDTVPIDTTHPLWALYMAMEHERIHLETSAVLVRELPIQAVRRPDSFPDNHSSVPSLGQCRPERGIDYPTNVMCHCPDRVVAVGKPSDFTSYGWDNEYGYEQRRVVASFMSQYMISNGQFHEFVAARGYSERRFWSAEGWRWKEQWTSKNGGTRKRSPPFWVEQPALGYQLRTMFEIVPMPWSWPAEVNYHEASAFCAWLSALDDIEYRLPTEAELLAMREATWPELAATGQFDPVMDRALDSATISNAHGFNLNLSFGSPSPVDDENHSTSCGFHDVLGNTWEWVSDDFHPIDGFQTHPLYEDFSVPTFDSDHKLILGGSFMSTGAMASKFCRFEKRPHFHLFTGFRVVSLDGHLDRP